MAETADGSCELCGRPGRVRLVRSEINPDTDWWLECADPTDCAEVM